MADVDKVLNEIRKKDPTLGFPDGRESSDFGFRRIALNCGRSIKISDEMIQDVNHGGLSPSQVDMALQSLRPIKG